MEIITGILSVIVSTVSGVITTLFAHFLNREKNELEKRKLKKELEGNQHSKISPVKPAIKEFSLQPKFADRRFQAEIRSEFLTWRKGTLLIWIKVPEKGQGIRSRERNKFIFNHVNGKVEGDQRGLYLHRFSFDHNANHNNWTVAISGERGREKYVTLYDDLDIGWHQFLISWDRIQNIVYLIIDADSGKKAFTRVEPYDWPTSLKQGITIGGWGKPNDSSASDAWIYNLEIFADFMSEEDLVVLNHFNNKPTLL